MYLLSHYEIGCVTNCTVGKPARGGKSCRIWPAEFHRIPQPPGVLFRSSVWGFHWLQIRWNSLLERSFGCCFTPGVGNLFEPGAGLLVPGLLGAQTALGPCQPPTPILHPDPMSTTTLSLLPPILCYYLAEEVTTAPHYYRRPKNPPPSWRVAKKAVLLPTAGPRALDALHLPIGSLRACGPGAHASGQRWWRPERMTLAM